MDTQKGLQNKLAVLQKKQQWRAEKRSKENRMTYSGWRYPKSQIWLNDDGVVNADDEL